MKGNHNECLAEIGTVTQAMKVQNALTISAIPSKVIKSRSSRHGCIYAVSYPCGYESDVRELIVKNGISVSRWTKG